MFRYPARGVYSAILSTLVISSPITSFAQDATSSSRGSLLTADAAGTAVPKSRLAVGRRYFITAANLNVRSSNSTIANNIVGKLSLNDEVQIVNVLNAATPLVQIKIIQSASVPTDLVPEFFVSKDFLSERIATTPGGSYFVVQNVATEKTRVYERCTLTPDCPHKMILETDMVVGRPEEGTKQDPHAFKTWLGHSRISEWIKFYQDVKGHYPHWYKAGQDIKTIPGPITGQGSKIIASRQWMVKDAQGKSTIYGAFGWYAAKVTPADDVNGMNYQWMHGTFGWGRDGKESIDLTRGVLMNLFSNPGSSGCTRLENRAIAYMQSILPVGTDIYRVYARETTREKEVITGAFRQKVTPLPRYADKYGVPGRWDYILLTDGAQRSGGLTADARTIIERAIPVFDGNLIEKGTYDIDQYPNPVPLDYTKAPSSGKSGDRYSIDTGDSNFPSNFRGYFLVDEGRFLNYAHPDPVATNNAIRISGLPEFRRSVPAFLRAAETTR